jgi:hypothetical protein
VAYDDSRRLHAADCTYIEPNLVTVEVERLLDAGYIPGKLVMSITGGDPRPWFLDKSRLTVTDRGG